MLPSLLSTNLCSLKSNVDRLAFSVLWDVHVPTGRIINTKFVKSVIRSVASFTYQQAQERMDNDADTSTLTRSLKLLMKLSRQLKQQRLNHGALLLASSEIKFLMDHTSQKPTDVAMYVTRDANSLVEEFMLLGMHAISLFFLPFSLYVDSSSCMCMCVCVCACAVYICPIYQQTAVLQNAYGITILLSLFFVVIPPHQKSTLSH